MNLTSVQAASDDFTAVATAASLTAVQERRERQMNRWGIQRYRQALVERQRKGHEAETRAGRDLMVTVIKRLVPAIEDLQQKASGYLCDARYPCHWYYLVCLDAERLALIVASTVFAMRYDFSDDEMPGTGAPLSVTVLSASRTIGYEIVRERRIDAWVDWRKQKTLIRRVCRKRRQETREASELVRAQWLGANTQPPDPRYERAERAKRLLNGTSQEPPAKLKQRRCRDVFSMLPRAPALKQMQALRRLDGAVAAGVCRHVRSRLFADTQVPAQVPAGMDRFNAVAGAIDKEDLVRVGGELIELLIVSCPDIFFTWKKPDQVKEASRREGKNTFSRCLKLTDLALQKLNTAHYHFEKHAPPYRLAMLCEPRPWRQSEDSYHGGYLRHHHSLISDGSYRRHTQALTHPVGETTLTALNAVQRTPWRINGRVMEVMKRAVDQEAWEDVDDGLVLPPSPDGDTRRALDARRQRISRALARAMEDRNKDAIWFPHRLDFRGRQYPLPQDLQPQGAVAERALLTFATGKPLGEAGEQLLARRLADCWGGELARKPHSTREAWADQHKAEMLETARDPFAARSFWSEADDRWGFLAACFEWAELHRVGARRFLSHLPLPVDGRCNGIQHLAAMLLDPALAELTNLTPADGGMPEDIYGRVAKSVLEDVQTDAATNCPKARWWDAHSSFKKDPRGLIKPCVMTVPYGISSMGMADQLFEAAREDGASTKTAQERARYLAERVWRRCETQLGPAMEVMTWLRKSAGKLAKAGQPLEWTAPSGMRVRMAYYQTTGKRIRLSKLHGRDRSINLHTERPEKGLKQSDQRRGAAPNVVHSFDAAHLALTVAACARAGIDHFATVHDSIATHACDRPKLDRILREQFAGMYRSNRLAELAETFTASLSGVSADLNAPPSRGAFDIERVLTSPYFFD